MIISMPRALAYSTFSLALMPQSRVIMSPKPFSCAQSIPLYLKLRAIDFGFRSLTGCAEGFRVLGVTQMHCLPEAGK